MNKIRLYKQLLSLVLFSFLLLTLYNIFSGYLSTERKVRKLTLERLNGIARQIATQIDADQHLKISEGFREKDDITHLEKCANYKAIHQQLAQAHHNFQLNSPIYTFVKSESSPGNLEFIVTSSVKPYFRHLYTTFPKERFAHIDQGGMLDVYGDEFGHWVSAFAPIKTNQGKVVGFVQADEKIDALMAIVHKESLIRAAWSMLGLAIVSCIMIPFLKKIVQHEEYQKTRLATSLEEITQLSKKLQKNEEALKENAAKLKQSNKDLHDFAHIASHDLKAPIRNIISFSQLLNRKADQMNDSEKEYLSFIISSAQRARNLITGLLKYSTADMDLEHGEPFEMRDAVEEACLGLKMILEEKNVKVVVKDLPAAKGNLILISQVLQNLINNGIKYNEADRPIIEIGAGLDQQKGPYYYVRDNGIGIPKEYQADIFKMFRRLHDAGTYEGSGIGLAFCARVINSYGGELWLESTPQMGSTFFFTLPEAGVNEEGVEVEVDALVTEQTSA